MHEIQEAKEIQGKTLRYCADCLLFVTIEEIRAFEKAYNIDPHAKEELFPNLKTLFITLERARAGVERQGKKTSLTRSFP